MNYCENLRFKDGTFYCLKHGELKCKCKEQKEMHKEKWNKERKR